MRKLTIAALLLGLGMSPALAQTGTPLNETKPAGQELSRADCEANFKTADRNGDGTLSAEEVAAADTVIPTALALTGPLTHAEFMAACMETVPKGG